MSSKKRRGGGGDHGGGGGHDGAGGLRWLLTYTDMVTLLLATFIVLWAQNDVNPTKMAQVMAAFRVAFGTGQVSVLDTGAGSGTKPVVMQNSEIQKDLFRDLRRHLLEERLDPSVNVHLNERGLLIRVYADKVKFARGSAAIPAGYKKVLDKVAKVLATVPNAVQVNGYTDDSRGDNWSLSAQRAVNTVKYLQGKNIAPERLSAVGWGQFSPLEANSSELGRAANRRIDIQVLKGPLMKELVDIGKVRQEFEGATTPQRGVILGPPEGASPNP